jgi:hypothetical protein
VKTKSKRIYGIVLIVALTFLGFTSNIKPGIGIVRDAKIRSNADADAYVGEDSPSSNYGNWDIVRAGKFITGDDFETYFHFNFSNQPDNFTKAEISLYLLGGYPANNISVCLISQSWNELSITWNNKPTHGQKIDTLEVSYSGYYTIDVTDYINDTMDGLSICLKAANTQETDYVLAYSKEAYYQSKTEYIPQLIWTFGETAEITVSSPVSSDVLGDDDTFTIKWNILGTIAYVIIQLFKGTVLVENITGGSFTENDGEYKWYVDSSKNYTGSDYRIKITDKDDEDVYDYSNYFVINEPDGGAPNSMDFLFYALLGGGVVAAVFVVILSLRKRKPKVAPAVPSLADTVSPKKVPSEPTTKEPQKETPKISVCPHCGSKLQGTETYCSNCGSEV